MTQRIRLDDHLARAGRRGRGGRPRRRQGRRTSSPARRAFRSASTASASRQTCSSERTASTGRCARRSGSAATTSSASRWRRTFRTRSSASRYRGSAELELGIIPGGYAWVFPKGDHVNVGVGGWESEGPTLRGHLAELCRQHGIAVDGPGVDRGHRLPLRRPGLGRRTRPRAARRGRRRPRRPAVGGRDVRGVRERAPRLRGRARPARRAVGVSRPATRTTLAASLGSLVSASWGAKVALDRYPARRSLLGRSAARVARDGAHAARGDPGAPSQARGLTRVPLKAIEALARRAGDPGRSYRLEATPA